MRVAVIIGFLTALATPIILFAKHEAAWVSPSEILAGLLFWPTSIASGLLILLSLTSGALKRPFGSATVTLCLALVFPLSLGLRITTRNVSRKLAQAEATRRESWYHYDDLLIRSIIQYVTEHPDRVSYPNDDDRALIAGIGEHLRSIGTTIPTRDNDVIDPWGNPIWIVMDHDGDMQLRFDDYFYGVWTPQGNKLVVALLTKQQYSLDKASHHQWQLEGGQIKNP